MDAHIRKVYVPMTETGFHILLCLQTPRHGYGVREKVEALPGWKETCVPNRWNE